MTRFSRGYLHEEYALRWFRNFLVQIGADDLDQAVFDRWCEHLKPLFANTRRARQRIVRKLCLHRPRTDPACFVPDPHSFAKPQPSRAPVLVAPGQVSRMLTCVAAFSPTPNSPMRREVLRLTLSDIDAEAGVIRVRESKFHKSRFVPLSPSAKRELRRYLQVRYAVCEDRRPGAPLLCNRSRGWRSYTGTGLREGVTRLFDLAGVCDVERRRCGSRLHRHRRAIVRARRFLSEKACKTGSPGRRRPFPAGLFCSRELQLTRSVCGMYLIR